MKKNLIKLKKELVIDNHKKSLGIVGLGYVGSAIYQGLKDSHNIFTFDIQKESNCSSLKELVDSSNYIFISVPTPMKKEGECDLAIIEKVISDIALCSNTRKTIIIKSTVPVGFTKKNSLKYNNLDFVFNPEFLTEANYIDDFKNQKFIILAGEKKICSQIKEIYSINFPDCEYFITDYNSAEMVKYTINNFLALKVSFANEIFAFCNALDIDYNEMIKIAIADNRMGFSHWAVPGPDGKYGFGGSCFPKDTLSLLHQLQSAKIESYIIKAAINRNKKIDRKEE